MAVTVVLCPDSDALLRQMSADLDLSPQEMARIMLESALLGAFDR